MKYNDVPNNEWIQPRRRGYKLACCDCGLVHKVDFRTVGSRNIIQLKFLRDERSTGQMRRWMMEHARLIQEEKQRGATT